MSFILFRVILPMTFTGSLVTILFLLLRPAAKRLSAGYLRTCLLAAAAFFVIPLSLFFILTPAATQQAGPQLADTLRVTAPTAPVYEAGQALHNATQFTPAAGEVPKTTAFPFSAVQVLGFAYLLGVGVFVGCAAVRYGVFTHKLRRSLTAPDSAIQETYKEICRDMELASPPFLAQSARVSSPLLVRFARPVIVLPDVEMNPETLTFALRHELCHYTQKDLPAKFLLLSVTALHWFNPFAHIMQRLYTGACEDACDEKVARQLTGAQRKQYAGALLTFADKALPYPVASFSLPTKQMKKRLLQILNPKKCSRGLLAAASLALCVVVCSGLLVGCSFAAGAVSPDSSSPVDSSSLPASSSMPQSIPSSFQDTPPSDTTDTTSPATSSASLETEQVPSPSGSEPIAVDYGESVLAWPLPDYTGFSRGFVDGEHRGLDLNAPAGTPIYAAAGGEVMYSGWHWSSGWYVEIYHGTGFATRYTHCTELYVEEGDLVEELQHIASVGSSGVSTGPHLHFEVLIDEIPVDPMGILVAPETQPEIEAMFVF